MASSLLRVVIDSISDPNTPSLGRYSEGLTRGLISVAPTGCAVEGIVAASTQEDCNNLQRSLAGIAGVVASPLARRQLAAAWRHGFMNTPRGMIHSPSLLAPLHRHERTAGDQVVVTLHEGGLWTAPHLLDDREVSWMLATIKRADRYADALVVPTHALARLVSERTSMGDRVRVIGPGVSAPKPVSPGQSHGATHDALPPVFVATSATLSPVGSLAELLRAMAGLDADLVIIGDPNWGSATVETALDRTEMPKDRVHVLGRLGESARSAVYNRAQAFVEPDRDGGALAGILDAFAHGTPVITSDAPGSSEIAAGAAVIVDRAEPAEYEERIRAAVVDVLSDASLSTRLRVAGRDRATAFSWRDAAEKVWQLHADL